jgi:hypothetical protein
MDDATTNAGQRGQHTVLVQPPAPRDIGPRLAMALEPRRSAWDAAPVRAATLLFLTLTACGAPIGDPTDPTATTTATSAPASTSTDVPTDPTAATTEPDVTATDDTGSDPTTDAATTHTIGGVVTGLQGAGLALVDGDGAPLPIAADGPFTFPTAVADATAYDVTVATQPADPEQTCTVTSGAGVVSGADVTDIAVTCITPIRHVVVIGIDGLGGAYLPMIDTPVLDELVAGGPHTLAMQNALPTMSAPNWMSMIAGASPDQHGVDSNSWSPGDSQPTPTMFAVVREQLPGARIGVFHDWDGFGALVEPGVPDIIESPGDEQETVAAAIAWMTANQPELLFIHLDLVDHAGHFNGWGSPAYLAAGATADALVGDVLQAIDGAGMRPNTVVLVSADHGGDGLSHGADTSLERPIPFIVRGPQLVGTVITREVRVWDIAATVVALFGLDAPASWLASPIVEALVDPPIIDPPTAVLDVLAVDTYTWVYDDTASGAFQDGSIWRPVVPPDHVALGDVAVDGHDEPTFPTLVIRDDPDALRPPVGYEQIWNDEASLGLHDVGIWNPIPPLGYTCLGSVAVADHTTPPATDAIRCVHQRYLVPGDRTLTWTDEGSLAFQDAGLWTCIAGDAGGQAPQTFITRRHHEDPGSSKCWSIVARGT